MFLREYSVLISSQDILKTISLAVNEETNGVSWERLGGAAKRRKCVTLMINALENAGLLLPEVIHENHEVTVTSPNICKRFFFPYIQRVAKKVQILR